MVTARGVSGVASEGGYHQSKNLWPINWHVLPDYVQEMKLVRPYGASQSRLSMMWTVGQLLQHSGSTEPVYRVTILEGSVPSTTLRRDVVCYLSTPKVTRNTWKEWVFQLMYGSKTPRIGKPAP